MSDFIQTMHLFLSKIERFYPWIYWFIFLSPRNCLSRRPIMLGNRLTLQFLCAILLILATFVCDSDGIFHTRFGKSIAKKRTFPYRDIATLMAREQLRSYNEWERPALNARNMESERYVLLSIPEKSRWWKISLGLFKPQANKFCLKFSLAKDG